MNNNQFRRLVLDQPDRENGESTSSKAASAPSTLGAKKSSFMPMTPRAVKGGIDVDFARQVRERNAALQPSKKFKSTAPKGVKYGAGYTDRAKARAEADDGEDEKAGRIKALEEQMKLGQIPVETFEALRDEIAGGDVASTHLVKGLDRRLLERVRRGEDVMGSGGRGGSGAEPQPDVDEELEKIEDRQVEAIQRDKAQKKGTMAATPPVAGVKRSRDEIMAELKAQRKAVAEAKAAPTLDTSKWKKVGEKERNRIVIDHKGREVLITVDEDGIVKRKVRKLVPTESSANQSKLQMPDAGKEILGADANVHMPPQTAAEESDEDDIFEGVGAEYNPLGNDDDDEDSSESGSSDGEDEEKKPSGLSPGKAKTQISGDKEAGEDRPATPRNYFKDTPSIHEEHGEDRLVGVQNILKKAAKMDSTRSDNGDDDSDESAEAKAARVKKRAEMLAQQDRDFDDMDMGFGNSRYDDGEDDGEGGKVKLSEWKGSKAGEDDEGEEGGRGSSKKKRKPKKRKGDANSMSDIMRVIEGRKGPG